MNEHVPEHVHEHVPVHAYVCMYVCMYLDACVHMYVYIHIYNTHIYICELSTLQPWQLLAFHEVQVRNFRFQV